MPIYAYRCADCGFAKDALQKVSDAPLTVCPSCNKPSFKKQLTAAGFQLKGTGWYVTDFRNGGTSAAPAASAEKGGDKSAAKSSEKSTDTSGATSAATPAAPAATPASTA